MATNRPLPPDVLARLRGSFGATLVEQMRFDRKHAESVGRHLQVVTDGGDLVLRFDWCGDEVLTSYEGDEDTLMRTVYDYAIHVADDLKEHRGRYGETLAWGSERKPSGS